MLILIAGPAYAETESHRIPPVLGDGWHLASLALTVAGSGAVVPTSEVGGLDPLSVGWGEGEPLPGSGAKGRVEGGSSDCGAFLLWSPTPKLPNFNFAKK